MYAPTRTAGNEKGEPARAPLLFWGGGASRVLESELEPVGQRTQLGVGGDTRNLTTSIYSGAGGVSAAVNAPVRIRKVNVVKYVVELELELSLGPLRNG